MDPIITRIVSLNSDRADQNIFRRLSKLYEEFGELNQAILNWTSRKNPKGKTVDDVVEEFVDVSIMAFDIAATFATSTEIIDLYNQIEPQMSATVKPSENKINDAIETLSLMANEIGFLASSVYIPNMKRVCHCVIVASMAMYCSKIFLGFHEDEICEIFKEKLDKWERNVAQKLDLCPTDPPVATPEQVEAVNRVLAGVQQSVEEHGWQPYRGDPNV